MAHSTRSDGGEAELIRGIAERIRQRSGAASPGKLAIRQCGADDLRGLLELVKSVGWQVTSGSLASVMNLGEMWCFTNDGAIVGSAGWVPHGRSCAWIVMVMTRPEWRGCSIATTLMRKVLERTERYSERMLDASEFGEPVYRRLGFKECAKVHLLEIPPSGAAAPRFAWRRMRAEDFPLPGTDELDPAHRHIFGASPEFCRLLEQDGRIVAWFLGRVKGANVHIGQIYAENAELAVDAFDMARAMLPGRTLSLAIPPEQSTLFAAVTAAGATLVRIHTRMYCADHAVPPFPPGIRGSAGPDFG